MVLLEVATPPCKPGPRGSVAKALQDARSGHDIDRYLTLGTFVYQIGPYQKINGT